MQVKVKKGHALSEYGYLIGLLLLVMVSSLSLLGHSIADLFSGISQPGKSNPMEQYMAATLGGTSIQVAQAAKITQPNQALPGTSVNLTTLDTPALTGLSPVAVNVSSVEGNDKTVLGDFRLAAYLDQIAQQETNPDHQGYYAQLAKLAYYMGANEGQIDSFDTYAQTASGYTNGDALNDLVDKSAQFKTLLDNPPSSLAQADIIRVMPVANEVADISANYLQNLHPLLNSSAGRVYFNFTVDNSKGSSATHANTVHATFTAKLKNTTYDALVPYDQLKAQVDDTLKAYPISADANVLTTFTNAKTTNSQAPGN